jgi:hypothetical protein
MLVRAGAPVGKCGRRVARAEAAHNRPRAPVKRGDDRVSRARGVFDLNGWRPVPGRHERHATACDHNVSDWALATASCRLPTSCRHADTTCQTTLDER